MDGSLNECVGTLNLQAALEALRRVEHSDDPQRQIRSALTHLESADVALIPHSPARNATKEDEKRVKRSKVIALEMICTAYLEDTRLTAHLWHRLRDNQNFKIEYFGQESPAGLMANGGFIFGLPTIISSLFSSNAGFNSITFLENTRQIAGLPQTTPVTPAQGAPQGTGPHPSG